MRASKTQAQGRTQAAIRPSRLAIENKDPNYDYSFRRRKDIEEGGGQDLLGYEPVGVGNSNGERFAIPVATKTRGKKQLVMQDTMLCRRHKETSRYFKQFEDQKYNSQMKLIKDAASNARVKLRDINGTVTDEIKGDFTQRPGFTEDGE